MYFLRTTALVLLAFFISDAMGQTSTPPVHAMLSPAPSSTMAPMSSQAPPTTQPGGTTEKGSTTPTTETTKPTSAKINFVAEQMWNASLKESESEEFKVWENMISMEIKYIYNNSEKYHDVKVSDVAFSNKDGKVRVEAKLSLVLKGKETGFIETVFTNKVNSGQLHNLKVVSGSAEFNPVGVEFKDWKAKDGECDKCSGAGGQITIERTCVPEQQYSCNGLKNEKTTKDCVTYCGAVGTTVSFLVLAFGMLLSFSSQ